MAKKAPDDNALRQAQGADFDPTRNTAPYVPQSEAKPGKRKQRSDKRGSAQSKQLIELADKHGAEYFTTADDGVACVYVNTGPRWTTLRASSPEFALLLRAWYYEATQGSPTQQALTEAQHTIAARASFQARDKRPVFLRTGKRDDAIYIDLGTPDGRTVEVTAQGWRILPRSPVMFWRPRPMQALPVPTRGGSLSELFAFLNIPEDGRPLLLGWLVGALRPDGPYQLLGVHGEQGSGKSTACKMLRKLIDPHAIDTRSAPRDERSLMIATRHTWLLALDNLSSLPNWLSDLLCSLATGAGSSARLLYTDDGEAVFRAMRPVLLNGIEEVTKRADLLDRALLVNLRAIPAEQRRTESELWECFDRAWPALFGALLDALACALHRLSSVILPRKPRMADFATWATAAEPALGLPDGAFVEAVFQHIAAMADLPLEASPIVAPLRELVEQQPATLDGERPRWTGTATALLSELARIAGDNGRRHPDWPRNGQALSGQLKRLAPNLRQKGIHAELGGRAADAKRTRTLTVWSQP